MLAKTLAWCLPSSKSSPDSDLVAAIYFCRLVFGLHAMLTLPHSFAGDEIWRCFRTHGFRHRRQTTVCSLQRGRSLRATGIYPTKANKRFGGFEWLLREFRGLFWTLPHSQLSRGAAITLLCERDSQINFLDSYNFLRMLFGPSLPFPEVSTEQSPGV